METKSIEDLRGQAIEIRDENQAGANTATRVGSGILNIVDTFAEITGEIGRAHV